MNEIVVNSLLGATAVITLHKTTSFHQPEYVAIQNIVFYSLQTFHQAKYLFICFFESFRNGKEMASASCFESSLQPQSTNNRQSTT